MILTKEILQIFESQYRTGLIEIPSISEAYSIRIDGSFGVALANVANIEINEQYNNVTLKNIEIKLQNETRSFLTLTSNEYALRREFSTICASFVDLENRPEVLSSPDKWWLRWRDLMGNSVREQSVYDVLGELKVYKYLLECNEVEWIGPKGGSVDLETNAHLIEVKSTLNKYREIITINSQHQLQEDKKTLLYFCKFEKSYHGSSINDVVKEITDLGIEEKELEEKLSSLGYPKGNMSRNDSFRLLEGRIYCIDEEFPRITKESFKGNKIPDNIVKIVYDVSLEGITFEQWNR